MNPIILPYLATKGTNPLFHSFKHIGPALFRVILLLASFLAAQPVLGFTLPDRTPGPIIDHARVLSPEAEVELIADIKTLREEFGFALTIVTVGTKKAFGWEGNLRNLAGRMRRDWVPENAPLNKSILVLISKNDQSAYVAVGTAYSTGEVTAPTKRFLEAAQPSLNRENFDRAALKGINTIIKGAAPSGGAKFSGLLGLIILALIVSLPFLLRALQKLDWFFVRFNKCPYCTRKTLKLEKQLQTYVPGKPGKQKEKSRVYCDWCGYRKDEERLSDKPDPLGKA